MFLEQKLIKAKDISCPQQYKKDLFSVKVSGSNFKENKTSKILCIKNKFKKISCSFYNLKYSFCVSVLYPGVVERKCKEGRMDCMRNRTNPF